MKVRIGELVKRLVAVVVVVVVVVVLAEVGIGVLVVVVVDEGVDGICLLIL